MVKTTKNLNHTWFTNFSIIIYCLEEIHHILPCYDSFLFSFAWVIVGVINAVSVLWFLQVPYSQSGSCMLPNFGTLIGNFEVDKWNFELKLRNSKLKLEEKISNLLTDLYFSIWFIFQIWCYYLLYKANQNFVERRVQKTFWSSRLEFRSFNSKFHFFEFQSQGACLNRFDSNYFILVKTKGTKISETGHDQSNTILL